MEWTKKIFKFVQLEGEYKNMGSWAKVLAIICIVVSFFIWGFIISKIWGWALVPMGLPPIGIMYGMLLRILTRSLFGENSFSIIKKELEKINEGIGKLFSRKEGYLIDEHLSNLEIINKWLVNFKRHIFNMVFQSIVYPLLVLLVTYILTRFI